MSKGKEEENDMINFHRAILLCASLITLWSTAASAVQLFLINEFNADLYRVDTDVLGSPEYIGRVNYNFGDDVIELVTASADHLYTFDRDSNTLITISTTDASIVSIATLEVDISPHPRGFDLSPIDGQLYGVLPNMTLRTINPTTGSTSPVASLTGANSIEAVAFSPDGTLYASASPSSTVGTHLYTINTTSGDMSLIGSMGLEIDTLAFAPDGYLYGATSGPRRSALYRIDPDTASRTTVGASGVDSIVGITSPASEPQILDVSIDIDPKKDANKINIKRTRIIKVAILAGAEFDAPARVNPWTTLLGNDEVDNYSVRDVDKDGDDDLLLTFTAKNVGFTCDTTELTLTGQTYDGVAIQGTDSVNITGCK